MHDQNTPYNDLIARIYAGSQDQVEWNQAMAEVSEHFGLAFAFVAMADLEQQAFARSEVHGNHDPRFLASLAEYQAERYRTDPTIPLTAQRPRQGLIDTWTDLDHSNPTVADHMRWHQAALGSERWFLLYTPPDNGFSFGFSAHFADGHDAFARAPLPVLQDLFTHMANAQKLAARPPRLDHEPGASLLIDSRGRVRVHSPAAEALLARHRLARLRGDRLLLDDPDAQARLDAAIAAAVAAVNGGTAEQGLALADGTALLVQAMPLPGGAVPLHGPMAIVRLIPPARATAPAALWRQLYGLTPAESRVAAALLDGHINLKSVADMLGIAHATARVHLARIFDKTGCSSQAQLVRQLTALAAHLQHRD